MLTTARFIGPAALISFSVLGGCVVSGWDQAPFKGTRVVSLSHVAGSAVKVRSENGSVKLTAANVPEATINAEVRARTQERLDQVKVVAVRGASGELSISVEWPAPGRQGSEGASMEIKVPDGKNIDIKTSNGSITVAGMDGSAVLVSSNGAIAVDDQDGPVNASTSNGVITITAPGGPVVAESSNGSIKVIKAPGKVKADSSNAKITVELLPTNPGPVNLDTSNGSIVFSFGPAFSGVLKASTSNGSIKMDGVMAKTKSKNSATIELGEKPSEAPGSVLDTSNESITIKKIGE